MGLVTIHLSNNQYLWAQLIIHDWKCFCDRPQFLDRGTTSLNRILAVGKQEVQLLTARDWTAQSRSVKN